MRRILVTGAAGFIGYHVSRALLERGDMVLGYDNLNEYYDVTLKRARLKLLEPYERFSFIKADLEDAKALSGAMESGFDRVIHLAAQAGVRYSIERPEAYISSNLVGTFNVLEACKAAKTPHLLFASSSSVYGANAKIPFSAEDKTDSPVSLYAATKKSNELMAYTYSHLFGLPITALRFFTVYGPYGRPDMALFKFTKSILENRPIEVYNGGDMYRDFTYIDDAVNGILALSERSGALQKAPPFEIYNIGNHAPVKLADFVAIIEEALDKKAEIVFKPMQPGDVYRTYADVSALERDIGFKPATGLEEGVKRFVEWYMGYYGEVGR